MKARASLARFPFAGALRALATLTIVFYHCWVSASNTHRLTWSSQACAMLGQVGVACFFALSGFLLGRRYVVSLLDAKPLPRWQDFARDRFLRIFPLYAFLVIALSLGTAWLPIPGERHATWIDALAHLTFLFPFFRSTVLTIDPPMWTMATDVQFYVALPLIAAFAAFALHKREKRALWIAAVIGVLILASIGLRVLSWPLALASFNDFGVRIAVFGMMPSMFSAFGSGMLAALVWERFPLRRKSFGVVGALFGVALLWWTLTSSPGIIPYVVWSDVSAGLSAGFILYAGCALLDFGIVENSVVRWAERLSYAVYLTHFFVIEYAVDVTGALTGNAYLFATFGLSYAGSLVVALPLYFLVELPFLELKKRMRSSESQLNSSRYSTSI